MLNSTLDRHRISQVQFQISTVNTKLSPRYAQVMVHLAPKEFEIYGQVASDLHMVWAKLGYAQVIAY